MCEWALLLGNCDDDSLYFLNLYKPNNQSINVKNNQQINPYCVALVAGQFKIVQNELHLNQLC